MSYTKNRGKLIIELHRDILSEYVSITSIKPYIIKSPKATEAIFSKAYKIYLIYIDKGKSYLLEVEKATFNDGFIELSEKSEAIEFLEDSFFVDYKNICTVATTNDVIKYRSISERINSREINNLGVKLENSLLNSDSDNEKLYTYLANINHKIDELLSYLRPKTEIEASFTANIISLSADNVVLFSDRLIDCDKYLFFYLSVFESFGNLTFATLSSVKLIRLNNDSSGIYRITFLDLNDDIKDNITRFIFTVDRLNLRQLNKLQ